MSKISPEARKKLLEMLANTPERKALLKKVLPDLEEYLQQPGVTRAWVVGSYTTPKPKPGDIDILVDTSRSVSDLTRAPTKFHAIEIPRTGAKTFGDAIDQRSTYKEIKKVADVGKERYSSLNWRRILGIGGITATGVLADDNAEAALPPALRKIYSDMAGKTAQSFKERGVTLPPVLYRYVPKPQAELLAGLPAETAKLGHEFYKPPGTYFTDKIQNIPGHLSGVPEKYAFPYSLVHKSVKESISKYDRKPPKYVRSGYRERIKTNVDRGPTEVYRLVPHPDVNVKTIEEPELKARMNQLIDEHIKQQIATGKPAEFNRNANEALRLKLRKQLRDEGYDVVHIKDVDAKSFADEAAHLSPAYPLNEYIVINPSKFSAFYENMVSDSLDKPAGIISKENKHVSWEKVLDSLPSIKKIVTGVGAAAGVVAATSEDSEAVSPKLIARAFNKRAETTGFKEFTRQWHDARARLDEVDSPQNAKRVINVLNRWMSKVDHPELQKEAKQLIDEYKQSGNIEDLFMAGQNVHFGMRQNISPSVSRIASRVFGSSKSKGEKYWNAVEAESDKIDDGLWASASLDPYADLDAFGLTSLHSPSAKKRYSNFIAKVIKDAGVASGVIGAGVLSTPEDSEAISRRQFVRQSLKAMGGIKGTPANIREDVKESGRRLPQTWLDQVPKIGSLEKDLMQDAARAKAPEHLLPEFNEVASNVNYRGVQLPPVPGMPKGLVNNIYLRAGKDSGMTPAHEVGHVGHGDRLLNLDIEDGNKLIDTFNRLTHESNLGFLYELEKTAGSSIHNPKELFAAMVGLKATNNPNYSRFPMSVQKIIDKYIPAIVAAGGVSAFLASPESAEAAPIGKWEQQTLEASAKLAKGFKPTHQTKKIVGRPIKLSILDRPSQEYTIASVLKKGKTEDYMVVVQSPEGERFQVPMTKDYLKVLAESTGIDDYAKMFNTKDLAGQTKQAEKSLAIRENNLKPYMPQKTIADMQATASYKAKDISPELVQDYVWFKSSSGETTYMPKLYAKLLSKLKRGTITEEAARPATPGKPKVPFNFSITPQPQRMGVTSKPDHTIPPIQADSLEAYAELLRRKALQQEQAADASIFTVQTLKP